MVALVGLTRTPGSEKLRLSSARTDNARRNVWTRAPIAYML